MREHFDQAFARPIMRLHLQSNLESVSQAVRIVERRPVLPSL